MKCNIPVKDVNKVNMVIGIRTTLHNFIDSNGQDIFLPCISYHLTQTDLGFFSPQTYHQIHSGQYIVQGNQATIHLPNNRIHIPIDLGGTNLPVAHTSFVTENQKQAIIPQMQF